MQLDWPTGLDVARRIHDRVIQRLFAVSLVLESDAPIEAEERERCRTALAEAIEELRAALAAEPDDDDGSPLDERLAGLERALGDVPLVVHGAPEAVPDDLQPVAGHFLVEAVRNAKTHAEPSTVDVRVGADRRAVRIEVENDGLGAPMHSCSSAGLGLQLVAAEARDRGGRVDAGPCGPNRWRAALEIPAEGDR